MCQFIVHKKGEEHHEISAQSGVLLNCFSYGLSVVVRSASADAANKNAEMATTTESKGLSKLNTALNEALREDGVTQQQWNSYVAATKAAAKEPTSRWKITVAKNIAKFAIKHSNLIPSKKVRNVVKKYGGKIINAIDNIKAYSWYGIVKALMKTGIPEKYASLLADFLVTFFL